MPTQFFFDTLINEWNQIKLESENEEVLKQIYSYLSLVAFETFHQKSQIEFIEHLGGKCC